MWDDRNSYVDGWSRRRCTHALDPVGSLHRVQHDGELLVAVTAWCDGFAHGMLDVLPLLAGARRLLSERPSMRVLACDWPGFAGAPVEAPRACPPHARVRTRVPRPCPLALAPFCTMVRATRHRQWGLTPRMVIGLSVQCSWNNLGLIRIGCCGTRQAARTAPATSSRPCLLPISACLTARSRQAGPLLSRRISRVQWVLLSTRLSLHTVSRRAPLSFGCGRRCDAAASTHPHAGADARTHCSCFRRRTSCSSHTVTCPSRNADGSST